MDTPILDTDLRAQMERWTSETKHWASLSRRMAHPRYGCMLALAQQLLPAEGVRAFLHALQHTPGHWFAVLTALTGANPIRPEHTWDDAVAAWLAWGRAQGILEVPAPD